MRKHLLVILSVIGILVMSIVLPNALDPTVPDPRTTAMTNTYDV